jgi:hypothetical protein
MIDEALASIKGLLSDWKNRRVIASEAKQSILPRLTVDCLCARKAGAVLPVEDRSG